MTRTMQATNGIEVSQVCGTMALNLRGDVTFDVRRLSPDSSVAGLEGIKESKLDFICYYESDTKRCIVADDDYEWAVLNQFWNVYLRVQAAGSKMIGFNSHGFHLPYLMRRSWLLGVPVPKSAIAVAGNRFWSETLVDLMMVWMCGLSQDYTTLASLGQFFGFDEPVEDEEFDDDGFCDECAEELRRKNWRPEIDEMATTVRLIHRCAIMMGVIKGSAFES